MKSMYVPTIARLRKYKGYKSHVDPSVANSFSTAAFRFGHSQIKNSWAQLDNNYNYMKENIPLRETFFNNSVLFQDGLEPTFFGLVGNTSEEVDLKFASGVGAKLFIPPNHSGHANLIAINIQRGRDHGLPGYNDFRRAFGFGRAQNFQPF